MSVNALLICSDVRDMCKNSTHASLMSASGRQSHVQLRHLLQYADAMFTGFCSEIFCIFDTMPLFPCSCVLEYASTSAVAGLGQLPELAAVPKRQAAHTRIALRMCKFARKAIEIK
jgi:hypothetical protein